MNQGRSAAGFRAGKVVRLASTSMLALAFASPAWADCAPDPAPVFGTTTCSGTDANGVTVNNNGITINVDAGATVAGIFAGSSATPIGINTINNDGTIQTATGESILGLNTTLFGIGTLNNNLGGNIGAIRSSVSFLNNQGTINGADMSALRIVVSGNPAQNPWFLQNSGTIMSTANARPTISYLDNRSSSFPYSISNSGSIINNGTATAIQAGATLGSINLFNDPTGIIRSAGNTAMVVFGNVQVSNEGLIQSSADAILVASNVAPGSTFTLFNSGSINGNIRVSESGGVPVTSIIDARFGVVNGSVILGSGNDILYTRPGSITGLVDGGAGTDIYQIDYLQDTVLTNGLTAPTNFEQLNVGLGENVRLTLGSGFFLLNGQLNLATAANTVGTPATLVNATSLSSTGSAINSPANGPLLTFLNEGAIATTHSNLAEFGVRIENLASLTNTATITATGGSALFLVGAPAGITPTATNSNAITADGTAVNATRVQINNDGTIASNQQVGVALTSGGLVNTGQVSGATAAVTLTQSALLRNTGTVSSANVGVRISGAGTVDNRAGGVITGGTVAIQGVAGTTGRNVRNAGTINGDVLLGGTTGNSNNTYVAFTGGILNGNLNLGSGGDRFVTALPVGGGTPFAGVSGTVTGSGRSTVVYMVDSNANWTMGAPPAPFSAESFDLGGNATLNLTSATPLAYNTTISGQGTANITADLTNNAFGPIITIGGIVSGRPVGVTSVISNGTLTTTRSSATAPVQPAVRVLAQTFIPNSAHSFTNAGTINVNDLVPAAAPLAGIALSGNAQATNSGTINLNGGIAVLGTPGVTGFDPLTGQPTFVAAKFTNSGTISQTAGGATARGIEGVGTIINTGTISVGGTAVVLPIALGLGGLLDNAGTITSSSSIAITSATISTSSSSLNPVRIINRSTGVISGGAGFDAINTTHFAAIDNAGTINGNVTATTSASFTNNGGTVNGNVSLDGFFGSTFVNIGGTVTGNLTLGSGNDTFISTGADDGVAGTITAGAGIDTYVAGYTSNATVAADGFAIPSDFEKRGIGAIGSGTTVTVTGAAAGIDGGYQFFGDGTIVNQATYNRTQVFGADVVTLNSLPGSSSGLAFVNQGNIYGGINGVVRSFENSGRISSGVYNPFIGGSEVNIRVANGTSFSFLNSGTIAPAFGPSGPLPGYSFFRISMDQSQPQLQTATITNTGVINSSPAIDLYAKNVSFVNTGTIAGTDPSNPNYGGGVYLNVGQVFGSQAVNTAYLANRVSFDNQNMIVGTVGVNALSTNTIFNNSGTITGDAISQGASVYMPGTLTSFVFDPVFQQSIPQYADQESLRVTNSGTIGGTVLIEGGVRTTEIVNSGIINVAAPVPSFSSVNPALAVNAGIVTVDSQTINFNNSGTINNAAVGGSAVGIGGAAGFERNSPAGVTAAITVTNSGNIRANGGALIATGPQPEITVTAGLAAFALSAGQSSLSITNAAGGLIETMGVAQTGTSPLATSSGFAAGDGAVALIGSADRITFANAGTVNGGAGVQFVPGADFEYEFFEDAFEGDDDPEFIDILTDRYLPGAILFFNSIDTVTNTGTINGSTDLGAFDDIMTNYGAINGNVFLRSGNDAFTQGVNGSLVGTVDAGIGTDALTIDSTGGTGAAFDMTRFTNFESLLVNGSGSVGLSGALNYATIDLAGAGITVASGQSLSTTGSVTITGTSGNERVTNNGAIGGSVLLGGGDDVVTNGGTIGGTLDLGEGANALTNTATGVIANAVLFGSGNDVFANAGQVDVAINLGEGNNSANNSGSMASTLGFGAGNDSLQNSGSIAGLVDMGAGVGAVSNTGTLSGGILFADADDGLINSGAISGQLSFGAGNDQFGNSGQVNTVADLGGGDNLLANETGGRLAVGAIAGSGNDQLQNAGTIDGTLALGDGNNAITNLAGGLIAGPVTLGLGNDIVQNGGTLSGAVDFGAGNNSIVNVGTITGTTSFGGGDDSVSNSGTIDALIALGDGINIVVNEAAGRLNAGLAAGAGADQLGNSGSIAGPVSLGDGGDLLVNMTGATIAGAIDLGSGNDNARNDGSISGQLNLGDGANGLNNNTTGVLAGVSAGAGNDVFVNAGRVNGAINLGNGTNQFGNSGAVIGAFASGSDDDVIANSGTMASLSSGGGKDSLNNSGTIGGAVDLGDGDDLLANTGTITGAVDLGGGADMFVLRSVGTLTAGISGGAGTDQVTAILGGTEASPDRLDFSNFTAFEALRHESGVGLISNTANFGLIDVVSGRLIGAAGSTINSNTIVVARGATFGSAGTVTGTIIVNGTLSPGASPGTMTVNGNVGFNQGSTAIFELTPTTTDRLVVNGQVVIAAGSTLNLTGIRPITPGTPLDLITATGGISGTFGSIIKSDTIFGFTRLMNGSLQLLGLFPVEAGFNPQITTTVTYVNSVLQNSQTSAGLLTSLPALVTSSGATNTAAFAQLHPEAFASASQIGIENGLALAKAMRAGEHGQMADQPALFGFAQGFGNWRQLSANADRGTAKANISGYGLLGGVGYGSGNASLALFAGYLDAKQDINSLGSSTTSDGVAFGASARISSGAFSASAMAAYDGSSAKTARALFSGATAQSKYDLKGWTFDISAAYRVPVSGNWSVTPQIGFTHISSKRGKLTEAGGAPFDLDVLGRKTSTSFVDGQLAFQGGRAEGAKFVPWLSAGLRHQLSGDSISATGGFTGLPSTLTVLGAERSATLPIVGAGFEFKLGDAASLFADYNGEFGKGTEGQNINLGLRLRF
jgi:hypothetical protein